MSRRLPGRFAAAPLLALSILLFPWQSADGQLQPPPAPANLTAAPGDSRLVTLIWDDPNDPTITAYEVRRSGGGTTTEWVRFGGSGTAHVSITIEYETQYTFELRALRGDSVGAIATAPVEPRPAPPTPPSPPSPPTPPPGGSAGPSPSLVDFEWTVTRDIEALHAGHSEPTGMWFDGLTLWIGQNGARADDAVYGYDLASGARTEEREFALDERNRAPRGLASDSETVWVADSGRDRLFAYALAGGERIGERDIALDRRNADARGIWLDRRALWVLDGRGNAVYAYDLASGRLLARYPLDAQNGDPRGIWSDGVTVWVSDHGAKRLFAYRLPEPPAEGQAAPEAPPALERVPGEEFAEPGRVGNNSPRGIWSDGDVMYVVDAHDARVYSYNMPDAIDARLASLTLIGVDIGEFDAARTEYDGTPGVGVMETIVTAVAPQRRATVVIEPPDASEAIAGHQLSLAGLAELTVTVTSADGSRMLVYRVRLAPAPWPYCLLGEVVSGFSLVVYEGGSIEDLAACAESRGVVSLHALHGGAYVAYSPGAPELVNRAFLELFAGGLPAVMPLVARSNGPPSADPSGGAAPVLAWPECLRGAVVEGFSAVVYAGGSVEELAACARGHDVTALYALNRGAWVSYIVDAPAFVNRPFLELFADGVPTLTPLIVKSEVEAAAAALREAVGQMLLVGFNGVTLDAESRAMLSSVPVPTPGPAMRRVGRSGSDSATNSRNSMTAGSTWRVLSRPVLPSPWAMPTLSSGCPQQA